MVEERQRAGKEKPSAYLQQLVRTNRLFLLHRVSVLSEKRFPFRGSPLRDHLLHDLDRRGDHNVTVAGESQRLGGGGGIIRGELLL